MAKIGLEHLHRLLFDQFAIAPAGEQPLARRDGHAGAVGNQHHFFYIVGQHGLLHKEGVIGLDGLDNPQRVGRGDAAVKINGQIHAVADGFPHGPEPLHMRFQLLPPDNGGDRRDDGVF